MKMYRKLITLGLFAPLFSGAQTGRVADSLYFYGQENRQLIFTQSNATLLQATPFRKAAIARLSWDKESGSFRRSQQAQEGNTIAFYTEGFEQLGRFRLAGKFRFDRVREDSLGWNLQGLEEEGQPYYFFAAKAGEYERQNYKADAIISYELMKNKVYLSTGVDYLYHWTTRSVDPRPDAKTYRFLLHPELSVRLGSHLIGAQATWGRGRESNVKPAYKNSNYAGNLTYVDRNLNLSLGYGHFARTADHGLFLYNYYSGAGIHYAGSWNGLSIQFRSKYLFTEQENTFYDWGREKSVLYSFVQNDRAEADLLITKASVANRQQLKISGTSIKTLNWSSEFNGTNYQYLRSTVDVGYWYRLDGKRKLKPEFGLGINWTDVTREDVVVSHYLQYSILRPAVFANIYYDQKQGRFGAGLEAAYNKSLQASLSVPPTQVGYFTKGIAIPDYLYYGSSYWQAKLNLQYQTSKLLQRMSTGWKVMVDWSRQAEAVTGELPGETFFKPAGNRLQYGISMLLYL